MKQDAIVGLPEQIMGERYIWKNVPPEATSFVVKSLSTQSDPVQLFATGNTFATINPTQPIDPASNHQGVPLARLPLVETPPLNLKPAAQGSTGWVFVGSLETVNDESDWRSLYILNTHDLKRPDSTIRFTYGNLRIRLLGICC